MWFQDAVCVVLVVAHTQAKRAAQCLDDGIEHVRFDADFRAGARDLPHGGQDRLCVGFDTGSGGRLSQQPLAQISQGSCMS